jgi:hypothetical protein
MRLTRKRPSTLNATSAIGGIVALGVAYLFLRSLPELIRYARISRM